MALKRQSFRQYNAGGQVRQTQGGKKTNSGPMAQPINTIAGENVGITMQRAQQIYKESIRSLGYNFSGNTSPQSNKIDIPGDARFLLGLATANAAWGTVSLKVNQSDQLEDVDTTFTQIGDNKEFYRIGLPLTGNDTIKLLITGYAAYVGQPFIFFFI